MGDIFLFFSWENYFYGARSELDFADHKRGSKSYYYIMYKVRNGQLACMFVSFIFLQICIIHTDSEVFKASSNALIMNVKCKM